MRNIKQNVRDIFLNTYWREFPEPTSTKRFTQGRHQRIIIYIEMHIPVNRSPLIRRSDSNNSYVPYQNYDSDELYPIL